MKNYTDKVLIGGKEKVDFPDLGKFHVLARVDTGAKTSSIHCDKVWLEKINGKVVLCAFLLKKTSHVTRFSKFTRKLVRSSNGEEEERFAVRLNMKLGEQVYRTEFTLSNRDKMNYPVLLGRKFLRKGFLVDVSSDHLIS